jgi:hypothetical protein
MTNPIWPAVWSAIAATFSTATATILLLIHLKNRQDSVRPELILEEWSLDPSPPEWGEKWGCITIGKLTNSGRGSALSVTIRRASISGSKGGQGLPLFAFIGEEPPSVCLFHADWIHVLPAGEGVPVGWHLFFKWESAMLLDGPSVLMELTVFANDAHGREYRVNYLLMAAKPECEEVGWGELARGLSLLGRSTSSTPGWNLRLREQKAKVAYAASKLRKRVETSKPYQRFVKQIQSTLNHHHGSPPTSPSHNTPTPVQSP